MAATVHRAHDAGLYLPRTTTLRLDTTARLDTRPGWLQAQLGLNRWRRGGEADTTVAQLRAAAALGPWRRVLLVAEASLVASAGEEVDLTGGVDVGVRRTGRTIVAARLYLPLDPFLLRARAIGAAVEIGRAF